MSKLSFLQEFDSRTYVNPMGNGRILSLSEQIDGASGFCLLELHGALEGVHLKEIRVLEYKFKQCIGTTTMMWLLKLADTHEVKVYLTAGKIGNHKTMSTTKLKAWYKKFGFTGHGQYLRYEPKSRAMCA